MKNYLIGWQPWETKFNDDPVTMELLPLRRSEFLRLLPTLDTLYKLSLAQAANAEKDFSSASDMSDVLDKIEPILLAHAKEIKGFQIDGADPKIEDVFAGSAFMPLVSEIVFRLIEISKVEKAETKNSDGQSQSLQ